MQFVVNSLLFFFFLGMINSSLGELGCLIRIISSLGISVHGSAYRPHHVRGSSTRYNPYPTPTHLIIKSIYHRCMNTRMYIVLLHMISLSVKSCKGVCSWSAIFKLYCTINFCTKFTASKLWTLYRDSPIGHCVHQEVARGCSGDLHYDRPRNLPSRMTDEMKLRKRANQEAEGKMSVIDKQYSIVGIPENFLHLLVTFKFKIQFFHFRANFLLKLTLCTWIELSNLETCAHTDIKILRNKFGHDSTKDPWFYITVLSQEMLYMSKNFIFYFDFRSIWCRTCESLNVKAVPHNHLN